MPLFSSSADDMIAALNNSQAVIEFKLDGTIITANENFLDVMGYAWAYTKYLTDPSIKEAENKARDSSLGLWGLQADQVMPPWEWRRSKRQ